MLRASFLFSFLFLLLSNHSFSQKKDQLSVQIDSLIKVTEPKFNGVVVISKKGKTVYSKAQGFADFEKKTALTIDSEFEIMSNTRQITAVLILKEVEKGRIDLKSPIKKYLPYLTQPWADSVTVHQLLNHSHGITDLQKPLLFKPGTDFKYGNLSYGLLGQIIAFTAKKSYSEVANALFKKLQMKNTFCYSQNENKNLVSGYLNTNNTFKKVEKSIITPESVASNGIISTVNDLAIWNNNLHKGKILKPESYQLMIHYNIKAQHNVFGKEKQGYGYGLRIVDKETPKYRGHTGLGDGFSSVNLYFPKSDVSLIILENQTNENSDLLYNAEIKIKNILLKSDVLN
ncbi:class A beta-lactamase-related serine hydrolase [Flavobacterium circumlabens]|uniref:Class A beta-lactamase-related serine hydrolase n=1 Tax=Flavobacterium circumlabens TaxID=2133765 RepID=A0A4Y7UE12_9FLAO|nr:CubicO group peptidase (beta-lactamase class C family) [Flavobacterium circumlabens]TEB44198.1 class A beta-lactamase-related serine hydrolase [Flavobacterium circumlabens]